VQKDGAGESTALLCEVAPVPGNQPQSRVFAALGVTEIERGSRRQGSSRRAVGVAFAVSLVIALCSTPAAAYRTAADGSLLSGAGRVARVSPSFAFALDIDSIPPPLKVEEVETALTQALAAWSAPSCTRALPDYAGRTHSDPEGMDGVNSIAWVSDWVGHGFPEYSAGSTDVQYLNAGGDWHIAEADIYLSAELSWSVTGTSGTKDLTAVLTHEVGHALGLLHPCEPDGSNGAPRCSSGSFSDDTMYPLYEPGASTLAADDIAGVCYLYPLPDGCDKCASGEACVNGACVAECQGQTCMPGEHCGFWGCAPSDACLLRDCTGSTCQSDAACAPFGVCTKGACARGTKLLTEACALTAECAAGACTNGRCSDECSADSQCLAGTTCLPATEPGLMGCAPASLGAFGDACVKGSECGSGLCVDSGRARTCTVPCAHDSQCPSPQSCAPIDGVAVCVNEPTFAGGGCAVVAHREGHFFRDLPKTGGAVLWSAAALASCAAIRRRKRRMQ